MTEPKNTTSHSLEIYKAEYDRLKAEQTQRIQFRDNLLMAHLTVIGAVIGFIVANAKNPLIAYAYLIIPWISSIIGWAYLNNDILISNIRDYLRNVLSKSLKDNLQVQDPFQWEHQVGSKKLWVGRKIVQMIMDTVTFTVPAVAALIRLLYIRWPVGYTSIPWLFGIDLLVTLMLFSGLAYWNLAEIRLKDNPSHPVQSSTTTVQQMADTGANPTPSIVVPAHKADTHSAVKRGGGRVKP